MNNKISVIVPVYNVEHYLHRCIKSILNQTYPNIELILVNDGSRDKSGDICDEFALKDNRVRVIHKNNEGSSCARNAGFEIAEGDFISFVDSDDYINLNMFETMISYLKSNDLDFIEISPLSKNYNKNYNNKFIVENPILAAQRIISTTSFSVWRRLYKKNIIRDMRFIPGIIHQDVFFTIDLLKKCKRSGFLNTPFYHYNTENESIIRSNYSKHKIEIGIRATEYITESFKHYPQLKETIDNYLTYYYTDHFFLLSRNTKIDPQGKFRKKLKSVVRASINYNNASLRSIMVAYLPSKLMETISFSYHNFKKN